MIYLLPRDFLSHRAQSIRLYTLAFDNFDFMPLELLAPSQPVVSAAVNRISDRQNIASSYLVTYLIGTTSSQDFPSWEIGGSLNRPLII